MLATKFGVPMDDAGPLKGALAPLHHARASRRACAAARPTASTSTRSTGPTRRRRSRRRCARSTTSSRQGKVRYVGCSNFAAWQVVEAQWTSRQHGLARLRLVPERVQPARARRRARARPGDAEVRPRPAALLPAGERPPDRQVQARRRRPRRARASTTRQQFARPLHHRRQLRDGRGARGVRPARAATRWSSSPSAGSPSQPTVASVIAGATRPEQVEENAAAVERTLGAEDLVELERLAGRA